MSDIQHRDLRAGKNPWEKDLAESRYRLFPPDIESEILIVGGGYQAPF